MCVGSTRPLRKGRAEVEGGSIVGKISMESGSRSHFSKDRLVPDPLSIKPFTVAFPPEAGGSEAGSLHSQRPRLGTDLSLGPSSWTLQSAASGKMSCLFSDLPPRSKAHGP